MIILDLCPLTISSDLAAVTQAAHSEVSPPQIAHFCVTRLDLPRGLQFAQLQHAARESGYLAPPVPGEYALSLGAQDEAALLSLIARLRAVNVEHVVIRESDAPWTGQVMAVGARPGPRAELRRWFSSYPLLK